MDQRLTSRNGETEAHARLKRLALLWAQRRGYSACSVEVTLPRCRYRADVAAYRPNGKQSGATAIFECKQALVDLRRDNGCTSTTMRRLEKAHQRLEVLERNLRTIQGCASPIHSSTNSIHTISARSTTVATNRSCGKYRHCKTGFSIARNSKR